MGAAGVGCNVGRVVGNSGKVAWGTANRMYAWCSKTCMSNNMNTEQTRFTTEERLNYARKRGKRVVMERVQCSEAASQAEEVWGRDASGESA